MSVMALASELSALFHHGERGAVFGGERHAEAVE